MTDIQAGIVVFIFVFMCFSVVLAMDLFGIHKKLRDIRDLLSLLATATPPKQDASDKDNIADGKCKDE
jgi:hypothetical protein